VVKYHFHGFNNSKEVVMNTRGFTLTELLIVIAIISILAMLSVPAYIGQQRSAARNEAFFNLETLRLLEEQFFAENGEYAPAGGGGPINYNATFGVADGGIEDILPAFRPGGQAGLAGMGLNFSYSIITQDTTGDGFADTFIASAVPNAGTRVASDPTYTIDQNNVRNW
jgi:prepilin-type N-terminal cleavage/methylation domain-containing protein